MESGVSGVAADDHEGQLRELEQGAASGMLKRTEFLKRAAVLGVGGIGAANLFANTASAGTTVSARPQRSFNADRVGRINWSAALKNKTIAIPTYTFSDENQQTLNQAIVDAAKAAGLNWKILQTDTQASAQTAQTAMDAYIARGVDAIILDVVPARFVSAQIDKAHKHKPRIPVFGIFSFSPLTLDVEYAGVLASDAVYLTEYMFIDQRIRHGAGPKDIKKIGILDTVVDVTAPRRAVIDGYIGSPSYKDFKVVGSVNDVDPANVTTSATRAVQALLTAHPDITAIWTNYPPLGIPAAQAVEQAGKQAQVKVYSHVAQSSGIKAVLSGKSAMVATSWVDLIYTSWGMVDSILAYFAGKPYTQTHQWTSPVPTTAIDVARRNSPDIVKVNSGGNEIVNWVFQGGAWKADFLARWKKQYNVG